VRSAIIRRIVDPIGARVMDDHLPSPPALEPPRFAPRPPEPAAARRDLERARRAEAARIAALVQFMLHDKGQAAKD
jgi:hypothetical protein